MYNAGLTPKAPKHPKAYAPKYAKAP